MRPNLEPKVIIAGTFDRLHAGHRHFFAQAAKHGSVTAIVARDKNVQRIKGKPPSDSERTRLLRVAHDPHISRALLGDPKDFLRPIIREKPDIIALGYDQITFSITKLKSLLQAKKLQPKIIRLKSFQPKKYKTSLLNKKAQ